MLNFYRDDIELISNRHRFELPFLTGQVEDELVKYTFGVVPLFNGAVENLFLYFCTVKAIKAVVSVSCVRRISIPSDLRWTCVPSTGEARSYKWEVSTLASFPP